MIKKWLRNSIRIFPHGSSRAGLRHGFLWERVTNTTELIKMQKIVSNLVTNIKDLNV